VPCHIPNGISKKRCCRGDTLSQRG
jgi:hypothetical protein